MSSVKHQPLLIGVLALQGAYAAHQTMLNRMGVATREIRLATDLEGVSGLILPGGESTTLLHLIHREQMFAQLQQFLRTHPCLGTCAGLILLAEHVLPKQLSFGLLSVTVQRNAYGRQRESSVCYGKSTLTPSALEMPLIRAPRIIAQSPEVEVLAWANNNPMLVQQKHILGCSFHPELSNSTCVHQHLIALCHKNTHCVCG